jgi:TRAP-type uncharacterized transport system substrate-binding protein
MRASVLCLIGFVQLGVVAAQAGEPLRIAPPDAVPDGGITPVAAHPAPEWTAQQARRPGPGQQPRLQPPTLSTVAQLHAMRATENAGLVGIVAGGIDDTDLRIATDLAAVLDSPGQLRVFPVAGKGSVQNVNDIVFTRGVDIGIVQVDVMAQLKREPPFPDVEKYLRYVTRLYDKEVHILAEKQIASVEDLAFKKVNFDVRGSGSFVTADAIFGALGVPVDATAYDAPVALDKLKRGEISALVYVVGKPDRLFQGITPADKLHFVPVQMTGDLRETYRSASLTSNDYPQLLGPGEQVETLSVGTVLAVYNWPAGTPRHRNVARFVDAFFNHLSDFLQPSRHRKWVEIDPALPLPGWTRFGPADEWIRSAGLARQNAARYADLARAGGREAPPFLANPEQRDALFKDFVAYEQREREAVQASAQLDALQRDALFRDFVAYQQREREAAQASAQLDALQRDALFKEFEAWRKGDSARVTVASAR